MSEEKTLKYRVAFKFSLKEHWSYSIWYSTSERATRFMNYIIDNINFRPCDIFFKITEKVCD